MSNEELINQLTKDLDFYFANGNPNSPDNNADLVHFLYNKWGMRALSMGFVWIVEDLQEFFRLTVAKKYRTPSDEFLILIRDRASRHISLIYDMAHLGENPTGFLLSILNSSPDGSQVDEDFRALVTYVFVAPAFFNPIYYRDMLREAYQRAEGTSYRIMLAFALSQCGELSYIKEFFNAGYFNSKDDYERHLNRHKQGLPNVSQLQIEQNLIKILVAPEMTGKPEILKNQLGLIGILAMDIASNVAGEHNGLSGVTFKRKEY